MIGLAGLAGLVIGCGSGDNANDSPKGCNLVTNYPCKTEEGRVCLPNPEKPGEGICAWKEEAGNDVETGKDIISKDTYSFPDNSVAKDNSQPVCESHAKTVCSDGDVYWKDSCGNLEDKSKSCDNGCSNGKCQGQTCDPHESKVCLDGDVYWQDSCGALEEKFESCVYSCSNGKCQGLPCDPQAKKVCDGDEIYWQDSCGNLEDWIKSCDYGCSDGKCHEQGSDTVSWGDSSSDTFSGGDVFIYEVSGCSNGEYTCNNGACIPNSYVCDGENDCSKGEDEKGCSVPQEVYVSPDPYDTYTPSSSDVFDGPIQDTFGGN